MKNVNEIQNVEYNPEGELNVEEGGVQRHEKGVRESDHGNRGGEDL